MKKIILSLLICGILFTANAQDQNKTIKSKIKEVTVFFNGAQITQTGEINLPAGQSTIVFDNLTQYINPQSIQVKGEGDFNILSVVHQINYLKSQEKSPDVIRVEDSLQEMTKKLNYQQTILSVYVQEETMLLANKVIGGTQSGVKIADLKEGTDYFRTRLLDIKTNQMNIQDKIAVLQKKITALNNQLATLNSQTAEPTSEILVSVSADAAVNAKLSASYYVTNAGWTPTYDVRAIDVNSPVELDFRANVHQNTGADWKQVKLTLSTGNPLQNGVKPQLNPWYLALIYPYRDGTVAYDAVPMASVNEVTETKSEEKSKVYDKKAQTTASYTSVNENQTNIEYEISIPYTIPADGKNYMVEIQKNTLNASYEYYCAPKLNMDVYLIARVSGWEKYNIVSGEMNLFFEGTYVGKSYIDTHVTADTLELSLGVDKSISVKREKLVDFSSVKILGMNKKETFAYSISVKNKKKQLIDIMIEDQLPISSDKDIEVEALEISKANYDKDFDKLTWKFQLKPTESQTFKLSYSVKYPKDKFVNLR
jgi:uncharacterized protein (TIGR02231 family)